MMLPIKKEWAVEKMDNRSETIQVAMNMIKYGEGCVEELGKALLCANRTDVARLRNAYPEYWKQYKNFEGKQIEKKQYAILSTGYYILAESKEEVLAVAEKLGKTLVEEGNSYKSFIKTIKMQLKTNLFSSSVSDKKLWGAFRGKGGCVFCFFIYEVEKANDLLNKKIELKIAWKDFEEKSDEK